MRSTPALRPGLALARVGGWPGAARTSHCARSAASGVRSSCAASAVKRRSRASVAWMRREQGVHRVHQRPQFHRCIGSAPAPGRWRRARRLGRQLTHRRQCPPHRPGHREQEKGQHQQPGQQLADHQVQDQLVAFVAHSDRLPPAARPRATAGSTRARHRPPSRRSVKPVASRRQGSCAPSRSTSSSRPGVVPHGGGQVVQVGVAL